MDSFTVDCKCGGKAQGRLSSSPFGRKRNTYFFKCSKCGIIVEPYTHYNITDAIKAWNNKMKEEESK